MSCELSIIVPVYNVAQYVSHCLQSIAEQDLQDYEVIIVNDASHDNSRSICSDWCREHPAFRLINHDVNKGLSEARNTGLDNAQGRYVTFIDSDDFIAPQTLGPCMKDIGDAEVLEYPIIEGHLTRQARLWKPTEGVTDFNQWMDADGFTHCYACNKIFRSELWEGIRFPAGMYYEDIRTVPYVLMRAHRIKGTRNGIYYYCSRDGSISRTMEIRNLKDFATALEGLLQMPAGGRNTSLYLRALNAQLSYHRQGGQEQLVSRRHIPLTFLFKPGLTVRQRLKAVWFKLTGYG